MVRAAMLRKVYDHLETLRVYEIYIRIIRTVTNLYSRCAVPFWESFEYFYFEYSQESLGWNDTCQYL